MREQNRNINRRTVLSASLASIGATAIPTAIASEEPDPKTQSTDPENDPLDLYLSSGELHVDTTDYPDDGLSGEVMEDVVSSFNSAQVAGDLTLYQRLTYPPIPIVEFDGPIWMGESAPDPTPEDHNCDVENDIDAEVHGFGKSEIVVTMDRDTARELRNMYYAGAGGAKLAGYLASVSGVATLPGWVVNGIAGVFLAFGSDIWMNIGDCGMRQEVTFYGPVPVYELEPIDH